MTTKKVSDTKPSSARVRAPGKDLAELAMASHDVAERRKAEADLKESEERFRALIENLSDIVAVLDSNGIIRYESPSVERVLGYKPEELIGKNLIKVGLIHSDDMQHVADKFISCFKNPGQPVSLQVRLLHKDGSWRVMEVVQNNLLDSPSVNGILVTYRDITERQHTENALQENEAAWRKLTNSITDVFFALDGDLRCTYWNRASEKLTGIKADYAVGRSILDVFPDREDTRQAIAVYREVLATKQPKTFENEYQLGDKKFVFEISAYPSKRGISVLTKDITKRKKREQIIKEALEYAENIIDTVPLSLLVLKADLRVTSANRSFYQTFKVTPEETIGQLIYELGNRQWDIPRLRELLEDILPRHTTIEGFDITHDFPSIGRRVMLVNAQRIFRESNHTDLVLLVIEDITERKQSEEALKLLNAYNRSLLEVSLDPLVTIGSDGRITDVNAATEAATGYAREQLIGTDFSDYFTDPEKARAGYRQVFRDGKVLDYALDLRHRDGHVTSVLYNASVYRDETGKVSGVFAAARDITERKRAEEELRKHREHLEELVEQRTRALRETEEKAEREYTTIVQTALDGFWVDDLKGRILDVNDSYCKMTGYSREELLTMSIPDIEASERPEDVARHIDKIMNHGYDRFETRHRRKDGTPIEVEVSVNYSEIGGGRLIVFVRDITARKRAEEALRESEGKLRLMFESINDGIVVTDLNGVIIDTNERAVRMGGCSSKEGLLGRGSLELIAPREHERAAVNLQKTLEQRAISNMEYTLTRADGSEYPGELSAARLEDASGNPVGFIAVVRDISERKLMQEKILASERLATLGHLSGNISHELRNPLGVIASSAYYLKSVLKGGDRKVEQHLERIKTNVDSAVAIIDSLLNLTRLKPPQLERLDLTAIIYDAITSAKVPPTVSLVRDFPEQGLLVDADRVQLSMCFKNIVKNAVEAMEGAGTLTVTVHQTADSQAEISFADTGLGIPTDNLTNIFQPLFSTKAKGIGFGLSIAKMIVERHGGIIEAKSELGKGANIIIRLPLEAKQHMEDKHV